MGESIKSPQFSQALNESARLLAQNRPDEAVAKLLPLYAEDPAHPDVVANLGGAYILQRRWNKAVTVLRAGVRRHPDNAMLWANLGAAELGGLEIAGPRQQERAIRAYERALQADPQAPNVHYHLGLIHKERGDLLAAVTFFQRALEVRPSDRDARYWLDRLAQQQAQAGHQAPFADDALADADAHGENA
jgi:tetratricopeptide (TPR) repeat protein